MTLSQFNALSEQQQYYTVWNKGVQIADRKTYEYKLLLYQIDAFYVEILYDNTVNTVTSLRSFENVSQLELYLDQIKLPKLD